MKQILMLLLNFPALTGVSLFALPLDGLTDGTVKMELLRGELLSEAQFDSAQPRLMPDYEPVRAVFNKNSAELNPSLLAESLYLYKKPDSFTGGENAGENGGWQKSEKTAVLNTLVSISSLAGIQYYSASRKKQRVFYAESSVIDNPLEKNPQADPVFTDDAPPGFTLYARQKDLSFGDNVYRYDYTVHDSAIIFTQTNCTPLRYGIIPAAAKENLRVVVAVIDADEYFLIYAASLAKVPSLPVINKKAGASFAARSEALIKWLAQSFAN
ncbi:MAG: hypothetical protein LBJ35_00255 [Spirochaetaceae bacterium]|jgi:hypothetical protein|nr:hypothetical protein [Spirochaetaceae bacterium]